jgi:hypothetical protein
MLLGRQIERLAQVARQGAQQLSGNPGVRRLAYGDPALGVFTK